MDDTSLKKIFISFTVIVFGFVGYWIIMSLTNVTKSTQAPYAVPSTQGDTSLLYMNNATNRVSALSSSQPAVNLTNEAMSDLSQEIVASMQDAPSTSTEDLISAIQKTDVSKLDSATIQKYADAQHLGLMEDVPDTSLKIVTTTDESKTSYTNAYTQIVSSMSSLMTGSIQSDFTQFMQRNDSTGLDNTIKIYDTIYSELYTLEVPRSALAFHKESIVFFGNMAAILQGIKNYQNDPLKAYLLGEKFNNMPDTWDHIVSDFKTL